MLLSSPHTEAGNDPVGAAVERGVAWVIDHPATVDDGGFLDIVDESLFYLTLGRLAADQASRLRYGGFLEKSLARLISALEAELALNKPRDSLMDNYHIVLAAHLLGTVDKPFASRDRIIGEAQRVLQASQREAPTFRITVALLLQHLGAEPQVDIDALLETSLINQVAGAGNLSVFGRGAAYPAFRHPLFYYALVHEIAALTDFGRIPASAWLLDRKDAVGRVLREAVGPAMRSGQIDLLAELVLGNHMLGLAPAEELCAAIDYLLARQRSDGSWGEQATPRSNRSRHAAQTATAALLAYRNSPAAVTGRSKRVCSP